ncbi:helix-turn-helix domain-containing protein [Aquisalinus flavus]|uniref:AraC family transcriptional regulator n=1 Tax=Aquisalinus flavus TaxID=1526572 RepID=A0A8J2V6B1_9PROT|nr:AraC family transcriptional regulator [Aquisalinus flavus]MBD0427624.1 AraC family transcriptional regulator ligand-binding domain-containing protein [Aquisalinus flavus]UNE47411.1 AraC family transcriptional regulator [Aquisalinus flavus]GGD02483.1 AraC family transcriptional regulator [Aquisalinus flavus]
MTINEETPVIPMNYLGFIYRELSEKGYDNRALFEGTNLRPELLSDPAFRTDFLTVRRFVENSLQTTKDIHLGPKLAARFEPYFIGPPAYAAMNAATFGDGLSVLARFINVTFPMIDFRFQRNLDGPDKDQADLEIIPRIALGNVSYFVIASALVVLNRILLEMLRQPIIAQRVETLIDEPEDWSDIAPQVSRVPVIFRAPANKIIVPADLLDKTLPGSDPINHARLVGFCEQLSQFLEDWTNPIARVKAFLETQENLHARLASVARETGYSERGLRRQLEQAGTSFRMIKDDIRRARAEDMLLSTNRPIQSIAFELGFDSASNFSRCFKRWTGLSPKRFRDAGRTG